MAVKDKNTNIEAVAEEQPKKRTRKTIKKTVVEQEVVVKQLETPSEPSESNEYNSIHTDIDFKSAPSGACSDVCGTSFTYNNTEFIALELVCGGAGVLAITAKTLPRRMRFSESAERGANDWRKSSIRKMLNSEEIKNFNESDLIMMTSDLTADTGEEDYCFSQDFLALPSDDLFRRFHRVIPSYDSWVWSLTPWAINYSGMAAVSARTQNKTIYSEQPNRELGVVYVCTFKRSAVEV